MADTINWEEQAKRYKAETVKIQTKYDELFQKHRDEVKAHADGIEKLKGLHASEIAKLKGLHVSEIAKLRTENKEALDKQKTQLEVQHAAAFAKLLAEPAEARKLREKHAADAAVLAKKMTEERAALSASLAKVK